MLPKTIEEIKRKPYEKNKHFTEAIKRGLPMFSEGFLAIYDWINETNINKKFYEKLANGLLLSSNYDDFLDFRGFFSNIK